ncbi:unnamed protein product [Hydatigera taeniaeformis]|uniref:Uncharacterized protein n=1 Tax=Hydatigena taeniaeformis TaxID=6205 RepID=A0A0R3WWQ3_HYDTA|nr:unnamed protein product [Hydatigera taeniaeformis]
MTAHMSPMIVLGCLFLVLVVACPSASATSVLARVEEEESRHRAEGLSPAVWRPAVKAIFKKAAKKVVPAAKAFAKKAAKAVKEFAVYEAAKEAYDRGSKWIKRHWKN